MELTGQIKEITPCYGSDSWTLTLYIKEASRLREGYEKLASKDLDIKVTQHREKRTLDANAYYWVLLTKLADTLRISKPKAHNLMLRDFGQPYLMGGYPVTIKIPDTDDANKKIDESTTFHAIATDRVVYEDETVFRVYELLRGSSEYNTIEMSILIDGLVAECKEQGIETATPEELERMLSLYGERLRNE